MCGGRFTIGIKVMAAPSSSKPSGTRLGIRINPKSDAASRIGAALPKSWGDYSKKVKSDAYYRALAEMFIIEMDSITSRVPRECDGPVADFAYDNVWRFVEQVLLDSLVLFEHWGTRQCRCARSFRCRGRTSLLIR